MFVSSRAEHTFTQAQYLS